MKRSPQLAAAQDPATPPERLAELARGRSAAVRKAVAANPNAPRELLLELLGRYPAQVLGNPVWPLLVLLEPDWIGPLPDKVRLAVARSEACPEELLRWAEAGEVRPPLLLALLLNPALPREARRRFFCRRWAGAAGLGSLYVPALPELERALGRDFVVGLRRCGFAWEPGRPPPPDPEMSEDDLRAAAEPGPLGWRLALAHPARTADLLAEAGLHPEASVRELAASRKGLPAKLQRTLAADPAPAVRRALAPRASDEAALALLAADPDPAVAKALLLNPLARAGVRARLRAEPEAPLHPLLLRLAHRDPDPAVRAAVARHPGAGPELRGALARDPDPAVRRALGTGH